LVEASGKGDVATVKRLLDDGTDPNAPAPHPEILETPLWAALFGRKVEVVRLLAQAGADLNDGFPHTPLGSAVNWGSIELLRELIAGGADVNRANRSHETPLLTAVSEENAAIVEELLKAGADPNLIVKKKSYETITNYSPIEYAAMSGHKSIVKLLVAAGGGGKSLPEMLLCSAAGKGDLAEVKAKVEKERVNINARDAAQQTPLICAAHSGRAKVVKYLIEQGADVNLPAGAQGDHMSPLIAAAISGKVEVVKLLIEAGADLDYSPKGFEIETALTYAKAARLKDVVAYLLEVQKARGQTRCSDAPRGVNTFDTNDAAFVIAADVDAVAAAFTSLIGAGVWEKNALGKKVKLTSRCYALWKIAGRPWTSVTKLCCNDYKYWPSISQAAALSKRLKTRALFVANSDTAGVTQYLLFDQGALVELLDYGTAVDNASAPSVIRQFDSVYGVDLSKLRELSVKKGLVFGSSARKLDLSKIKSDLDYVNEYVAGQDAYIFFGIDDWGKPGERVELTLEGLGPDDVERLDYVAVAK
jgi:ankyrin repeat protein